ncbi:UNVERIFIED_CONTAM: hypothetical protein RF648_18975 [Kocuria sp. CPCC 205274]
MATFDYNKQNFGVLVNGIRHRVMYTNWKGETRERCIIPINMWYGETEFHKEPQWLLTALDTEKNQVRDFALKDMTPLLFNKEENA